MSKYFAAFSLLSIPSAVQGAGMSPLVNFYQLLVVETLGLSKDWLPTASAVTALTLCIVLGIFYRSYVRRVLASDASITKEAPPQGGGAILIESILEFLHSLTTSNCGKYSRLFFPVLASFFLYILICNLTGLVPGFPPATENISSTLALGLIAFILYNYAGLREHGLAYVKQFFGSFIFIAPLFFIIEVFSHLSRPISLSLRLMVNIFADHLLLNVFSGLTYLLVPAMLLFFGLLVACLQSFVFTLLTSIYISMAVSHDH